jgi:hypothetical protein
MQSASVPADQHEPCCPTCRSKTTHVRAYRTRTTDQTFARLAVYRCAVCGLAHAWPAAADDALSAYYQGVYRSTGQHHRLNDEPDEWSGPRLRALSQFEFIRAALGRVPESWLDVGAGYGFLLDAARSSGVLETAATEADPHSTQRLLVRNHQVLPSLSATQKHYDVVSFSHVLEHFCDPVGFFREAARSPSAVLRHRGASPHHACGRCRSYRAVYMRADCETSEHVGAAWRSCSSDGTSAAH